MTVESVGQFPVTYQVLDPQRNVGVYMVSAGYFSAPDAKGPVLARLDIQSAVGYVLATTLVCVPPGEHRDLNLHCVVADEEGATAYMTVRPAPIAWPHRDLMDFAQHLGLYRPGKDRPKSYDWEDDEEWEDE